MKKLLILLVIIITIFPMYVKANSDDLLKNAKSGVLLEATTGEILYEKNKNDKVAVASMTKMVAQIIILENIENGNLSWDEKIKASSNASGMGGSQIWLQTGEEMSVRDLMKGITMASANELAVSIKQLLFMKEQEWYNYKKLCIKKVQ